MELKSVSSLVCYVSSLDETTTFYEKLGFRLGKRDDKRSIVYLNWFSIELRKFGSDGSPKSLDSAKEGWRVYVKVENLDDYTQKPEETAWGYKEVTVNDPDGYRLILFEKL